MPSISGFGPFQGSQQWQYLSKIKNPANTPDDTAQIGAQQASQAALQFQSLQGTGQQNSQPASNTDTATTPTRKNLPGAMSLAELQGRMQAGGIQQMGSAQQMGDGEQDQIQKELLNVTKSVVNKTQAAAQANANKMPSDAIGQLKSAFGDVASLQARLMKEFGKNGKLPPELANVQNSLNRMGNKIAEQANGILQASGVSIDKNDVKNILTDGFAKKNGGTEGALAVGSSSQARESLRQKAESLVKTAEASLKTPGTSQSQTTQALSTAKAISTLLEDFGNGGYMAQRIQTVEKNVAENQNNPARKDT